MTSLSRFIQDSVIVVRFFETECVGPLKFAKTKSLCTTLSQNHSRLQTCNLAVSGTKNDQGTLEACQSPYPNALSCLLRVPATDSLSIHWDQPPAYLAHAHQCKCPGVHKQTRITLILNKAMFFQLARQMFLPTSRRCPETQHGFTHSPNYTSAIRQNLPVSTFRWLCVQLFAFSDFSVEKSLCVDCHKSFVSLITFVETPCQEHTDALY